MSDHRGPPLEVQVQSAAQAVDVSARVIHVVQAGVHIIDDEVDLRVDVPVNACRNVVLPAGLGAEVGVSTGWPDARSR